MNDIGVKENKGNGMSGDDMAIIDDPVAENAKDAVKGKRPDGTDRTALHEDATMKDTSTNPDIATSKLNASGGGGGDVTETAGMKAKVESASIGETYMEIDPIDAVETTEGSLNATAPPLVTAPLHVESEPSNPNQTNRNDQLKMGVDPLKDKSKDTDIFMKDANEPGATDHAQLGPKGGDSNVCAKSVDESNHSIAAQKDGSQSRVLPSNPLLAGKVTSQSSGSTLRVVASSLSKNTQINAPPDQSHVKDGARSLSGTSSMPTSGTNEPQATPLSTSAASQSPAPPGNATDSILKKPESPPPFIRHPQTSSSSKGRRGAKSQLEETYAPYILPSDKSVDDAKLRLRTAIEQSLSLRKAFTERLYEKYRIILRPVPKSSEAITSAIQSQPKIMHDQLLQQISAIQNEKDMEKKISQQINTELAAAASDPIEMAAILGGLTGVENAEQLSWFGAGLNLVILPEEDVDESELIARGIKERAPVDPETGSKIRDLSAAAAVASSAMLDRVRKGAEIRRNRMRKQQTGTVGSDLLEMSMSYLPTATVNTTQNLAFVSPKRKGGRGDSQTPPGKSTKGKTTAGSLTSLLSMSADAEGIRPNGKPSAVAFALMNNSLQKIASHASKSSMYQHPVRHPFPQSKGARSMSYHMPGHLSQHPFALPNLSKAIERRKKIASLPNCPGSNSKVDDNAKSAIKAVLERLVVKRPGAKEVAADTSDLTTRNRRRFGLKRKVSEIGVLRNTRLKKPKRDLQAQILHGIANTLSKDNSNDEIDPLLAMSVMQSLGLIANSSSCEDKPMIDDCVTINKAMEQIQQIPTKNLQSSDSSEMTKAIPINLPPDLRQETVVNQILDPDILQEIPTVVSKTIPSEIQVTGTSSEPPAQPITLTEKTQIPSPIEGQPPKPLTPSNVTSVAFLNNQNVNENSAYVPSLRGGGGEDEDSAKDQSGKDSNSISSSRSNHTAPAGSRQSVDLEKALWNQQKNRLDAAAALSQDASSLISPQHQAYAMMAAGLMPEQVSPNLYQQTNHSNGVSAAMNMGALQGAGLRPIGAQNQFRSQPFQSMNNAQMQNQLQIQQAAAALQSGQFLRSTSGNSDIGDYFGNMRQVLPQGYANHGHNDWTSLAAQQSILQGLPAAALDQASLGGMSPHQAALLVRDRNAQVLLAREQQHLQAQVAAAHQNAAAAQMALSQANFLANSSQSFAGHSQTESGKVRDSASKFARSQSAPTKKIDLYSKLQTTDKGKTGERSKTNEINNEKSERPILRPASAPIPTAPRAPVKGAVKNTTITNATKIVKEKRFEVIRSKQATQDDTKMNASLLVPAVTKLADSRKHNLKTPTNPKIPAQTGNDVNGKKNVLVKTECSKNVNAKQITQSNVAVPKKSASASASILNAASVKVISSNELVREPRLTMSTGMKMMIPARSTLITEKEAHAILKGHFHETLRSANKKDPTQGSVIEIEKIEKKVRFVNEALLDYLLKVGAAVPFPKTLVSNALKDRLNGSFLKSTIISLSSKTGPKASPNDIIGSVIITWLWANYQSTFKAVFANSGRIDVDPDCKWLIKAAVEKATVDVVSRGLESIHSAASAQYITNSQSNDVPLKIAKLVSNAMGGGICLNANVNAAIPNIGSLVKYLDELRMKALRVKCQEKVLLASLISKRTRMSEAFSNAFTSSMVRAGAALGYDDLGEIVQNESTKSSSQMPFDILSDSSGAWEDPCRPLGGYGANLDSDELVKRAHARAMIQRSLKKLQDRHGIKGGTSSAGPYSDSANDQTVYKGSPTPAHRPSPRSGIKRKASFSGAENLKNMSTAATVALFNPTHDSSPFIWDSDYTHNTPYGRSTGIPSNRNRSPSVAGRNLSKIGPGNQKRLKLTKNGEEVETSIIQSTKAIEWSTVAKYFEDVKPVEKPSASARAKDHDDHNVAVPLGSTIIAPFCRKIEDDSNLPSDDDSETEEENFDDEHILSEHEKVLDTIKLRFDTMMRIRQECQDKSRRASFGR